MSTDPSPLQATPAYRNLSEAVRRIPPGRKGRPTHVATMTRWIVHGVRANDGARIRLRARRLPGRWVVTDDWVDEFLDAVTRDRMGELPRPPRTAAATRGRSAKATARLDSLGF